MNGGEETCKIDDKEDNQERLTSYSLQPRVFYLHGC